MAQWPTIDPSFSDAPVGLFRTDPAGRVISCNETFRRIAYGGVETTPGSAPWANAHPGDRAAAELAWRRGTERRPVEPFEIEFRVWHSEGHMVWVRLEITPEKSAFGPAPGFVGAALDITASVSLQQMTDRLTTLMGAARDAVLVLDRHGAPVYTNDAARELFGASDPVDLLRDPSTRALLHSLRDQLPREVLNASASSTWNGEIGFQSPDGLTRTLDIALTLQRTADGVVQYWAAIIRDVTAAKQLQVELAHQATHDALTGLPNRTLFLRNLAEALERRNGRTTVAVLFLDLDKLKDVNDNVGHDVGDQLLAYVASRLASATRPADIVARIGGDEFVVLCDGIPDEHVALDLAERVRSALTGRAMVHGVEVEISVSVGVAMAPKGALSDGPQSEAALTLLRQADTAMYRAKRRGRSRCELYTEAMRADATERKELAIALERALANDELVIAYQPILSAHSSRVVGAEALLRWRHPGRGELAPLEFVGLAEESGAIVPMGDWIIRRACADASQWIRSGVVDRSFSVHVNISGRQLTEEGFVERVLATVRDNELVPQQLTLDFDEGTLHGENATVMRTLQALRRFGVRLALDGFGTGVSSLTALRRSPADVVKLDGTVGRSLGAEADEPLVRTIIQLAHALDMEVVAEWVTSTDQLHRLRMMGCDMVQGFLIGEPVGADDFVARARTRS